MPRITNQKTGESIEAKEGEMIRNACEELGVPFCCTNGICGTCMIDVIEGEENLSELTQNEIDMERDKKHRLACQCQIKNGDVKIEF
ncbi:2Fe-2S iron-sulfur cluster binding domain-containing protein [Candidatus Pacearchaeota archaeon]|nr:2Fe-2S iron-sulfur cluster binding domain-containing protein [Candidatus Pacearchaeota archaeon]